MDTLSWCFCEFGCGSMLLLHPMTPRKWRETKHILITGEWLFSLVYYNFKPKGKKSTQKKLDFRWGASSVIMVENAIPMPSFNSMTGMVWKGTYKTCQRIWHVLAMTWWPGRSIDSRCLSTMVAPHPPLYFQCQICNVSKKSQYFLSFSLILAHNKLEHLTKL